MTEPDLDERLLRWGAGARAAAPDVAVPDVTVPELESRPRRRTLAVLAVAAAVAATAVTGAVLAGHGSHDTPASAQREWRYHGVAVDVPRSWPANALRCGQPQRDTVIIDPPSDSSCASTVSLEVSSVELERGPSISQASEVAGLRPGDGTVRHLDLHGLSATRSRGVASFGESQGLHVVAIAVPGRGVVVVIASPSATVAARIAATVHRVPVTGRGTLHGVLEEVGGPAPGGVHPTFGSLVIRPLVSGAVPGAPPVVRRRTGQDGRFTLRLRPGSYLLKGSTSRQFPTGPRTQCLGNATVTDAGSTTVHVVCPVP